MLEGTKYVGVAKVQRAHLKTTVYITPVDLYAYGMSIIPPPPPPPPSHDVEMWLKVVGDVAQLSYKQEKVIWEYLDDGGLWQALSNEDCYKIEAHFCEQSHSFHLGDAQLAFQYNLNNMTRSHPRTKHHHRLKRTLFIEEQPEGIGHVTSGGRSCDIWR